MQKLFLIFGLLFLVNTGWSSEIPLIDLKLKKLQTMKGDFQPSGMVYLRGKILFVSDAENEHAIYELDGKSGEIRVYLDLEKQESYKKYIEAQKLQNAQVKDFRVIDYEGLAYCPRPDTFFLLNERSRHVLVFRQASNKKWDLHVISDFDDKDINLGGPNAGLEGVAVDCARKTMYVAKERDPKKLYQLKYKDRAFSNRAHFAILDLPVSPQELRKVKVKKMGDNNIPSIEEVTLSEDISDLTFSEDKLFVLHRNAHEISVFDPKSAQVLKRYSYGAFRDHAFDDDQDGIIQASESGLYDTGEPYGLAEALMVNGKEIVLLLDNNKKPISAETLRLHPEFSRGASEAMLLQFQVTK